MTSALRFQPSSHVLASVAAGGTTFDERSQFQRRAEVVVGVDLAGGDDVTEAG